MPTSVSTPARTSIRIDSSTPKPDRPLPQSGRAARKAHESDRPPTAAEAIDRSFHAALARSTGGLSPAALALAFADWQLHLMMAPGKQLALGALGMQYALQFAEACMPKHLCFEPWTLIRPPAHDRRFVEEDWKLPVFNMWAQGFLLAQ